MTETPHISIVPEILDQVKKHGFYVLPVPCNEQNGLFALLSNSLSFKSRTIHPEFGFLEQLSVLENILLIEKGKKKVSDAKEALQAVGMFEKAEEKVQNLSISDRLKVCVAKEIAQGADLIMISTCRWSKNENTLNEIIKTLNNLGLAETGIILGVEPKHAGRIVGKVASKKVELLTSLINPEL